MAQYPKTTGALVTVNIRNANKAGGDGRMKLDAQLIEMMDILHPVGEVKFMMTDQVDPWIEKMAVYDQVWARGDGSLVKVADYPRIFNDIGFKYGWSNTNPNSTYTYTFTDNNGVARSLVIYEDLDIDGNAKPVPDGESPLYFRLPNLAGRFLRCAGTASYVNKWTDTDGTVRQLLTEYKAEMYRGQLDAQRGISGSVGTVINYGLDKLFYPKKKEEPWVISSSGGLGVIIPALDISRAVPTSNDPAPVEISVYAILRIA